MANAKDKYWSETYNTINNYNGRNHTILPHTNTREAINKLLLEEQAKSNNVMVDKFNPQRNKSEYLIDKVTNLKVNNRVGNNLIDNIANLKINKFRNDMIIKVINLTINDIRNNSNKANTINAQVQFAGNPAVISYKKLLSG